MMWSSKGGEAQPHELAVLEEGPGERNEHSHVTLQETDAKEAHQSYDETDTVGSDEVPLILPEEGEGEGEGEGEEEGEEGEGPAVRNRRRRRLCWKNRLLKKWNVVNSWKTLFVALAAFAAALAVSLLVSFLTRSRAHQTGAVATDMSECSEMAGRILEKGGSAVDAAITAMLCIGCVNAASSGIGGGGFMLIRDTNGSVHYANFREAASSGASVNMFKSNSTLSTLGGLAVAVPGEVRGMELVHQRYGRLPWRELFEPVIKISREGFKMSKYLAKVVDKEVEYLRKSPVFLEMYFNDDGSVKKEGDTIQRPEYADTLELIAESGAEAFYTGEVAESIVDEVQKMGGIISMEDLAAYQAVWQEPLHISYAGYEVYAPGAPGGGPTALLPLNIMDHYNLSSQSKSTPLTYHRMVESFKYAFALRSFLGDPLCEQCNNSQDIERVQENMTSESFAYMLQQQISDEQTFNISHYNSGYYTANDHGTSHLSVIAPDGQTVSATVSVNLYFGSKLITSTGIVLNNEMDDFSSPNITNAFGLKPSEANFIHPGKRPLSSMSPTIVVKEGEVFPRLVVGAAGGTRITTSIVQAIVRVLSFEQSVEDSIEAKRMHHQLIPNAVATEEGFPADILNSLEDRGHSVVVTSGYIAVVQGIESENNGAVMRAHSDSRKGGHAYELP